MRVNLITVDKPSLSGIESNTTRRRILGEHLADSTARVRVIYSHRSRLVPQLQPTFRSPPHPRYLFRSPIPVAGYGCVGRSVPA